MSHQLLMALFGDRRAAAEAARELNTQGVARADLSVVASDHQTEGAIADDVGGSPGSEIEDSRTAGHLGELGGFLLAAIAIGMPGTGAIVAAGPLAAELGELAGHAAGSLASVLTSAGLPHDRAEALQRDVGRGAVLLGVHVAAPDVARVRESLSTAGATAIEMVTWP